MFKYSTRSDDVPVEVHGNTHKASIEKEERKAEMRGTPLYKPYFGLFFFTSFRVPRVHHIDHTGVQM